MKMKRTLALATALALLAASLSFGLALPLRVKDLSAYARVNVPLMNGIPLPEGAFMPADTSKFTVQDSITGTAVPAGFRILSKWPTGSIKFLAVMFQATVTASGNTTYMLTDNSANPAGSALTVTNASGVITVNTGVLTFKMKSSGFNLIDEAWLNATGTRILVAGNGSFTKADIGVSTGRTATLSVEYQNREQVCIRAEVHSSSDEHVFIFYVTAFRNKPYVKIVQNWYYNVFVSQTLSSFTDLNITYKSAVTGNVTATFSRDTTGKTTADAQMDVPLTGSEYGLVAYPTANNYMLKKGAATLTTGLGQNLGSGGTKKMGWVHMSNGTLGIGTGMRYFWEMAPKHLYAKADGTLELGLFSRYGTFTIPWAGGFGRTHLTFLSFGTDVNMTKEAFYSVAQPLMAIPPAVWLCGMTKAFGPGVVHGDKTLFSTDVTQQNKYQSLFNVYKTNQMTHGYNAYKTPFSFPFFGTTDLHNFISFGDNVDPVNSHCAGVQHFGNNYYDMPWLSALCYANQADYAIGLFGMERALHCADMDHNQTNGDCKGCPGVQQLYGYQECSPRDWGNANHWKTTGIFYWYFIYGEPVLKEQGIRITQYPMNSFVNSGEPRSTGHSIEGLVSAYEATGDNTYLTRAQQYYVNGSWPMNSLAASATTISPAFQTNIVGEAMSWHTWYDRSYQNGKDKLVQWAKALLATDLAADIKQWRLQGLAGAIEAATLTADKTAITNAGKTIFNAMLDANPIPAGRGKDQCEMYKAPIQFLKYMVTNPNYLTTFPQYATLKIPTALEEGPEASATAPTLLDASPNPFNPEVTLTVYAPEHKGSALALKVFDVTGREVADLTRNIKNHQVLWNASGFASGIYLVRLTQNGHSLVKQITLLK